MAMAMTGRRWTTISMPCCLPPLQRLFQEHPAVPRNWAIRITQDSRRVGVLPFEAGLKVLVRPYWAPDLSMPEAPVAGA
jgi:hypothetical protein